MSFAKMKVRKDTYERNYIQLRFEIFHLNREFVNLKEKVKQLVLQKINSEVEAEEHRRYFRELITLGFEHEFIGGRFTDYSFDEIDASYLVRNGDIIGCDGAGTPFEFRSMVVDFMDKNIDLYTIYNDFLRGIASMYWVLYRNDLVRSRNFIHALPNRIRWAVGVHLHVGWGIVLAIAGWESYLAFKRWVSNGIGFDVVDVFKPVIEMTKEVFGDRNAFSDYGDLFDWRSQPHGIEVRGFEGFGGHPLNLAIFMVNIMRALYYYLKRNRTIPKNQLIPFLKPQSISYRKNYLIKRLEERRKDLLIYHYMEQIELSGTKDDFVAVFDNVCTLQFKRIRVMDNAERIRIIDFYNENKSEWQREYSVREMEEENHRWYGVYDGSNSLIGVIAIRVMTGEIARLVVRRDKRRIGIGSIMVASIIKAYSDISRFIAFVHKQNEASRRFFESLGFKVVEEGREHLKYALNITNETVGRIYIGAFDKTFEFE